MSSKVKGVAASNIRVSIPSSVRKTIENLKELTGQNHSEDEIYAMLKECSMDPNETAQKLLLFDTFHEVKRKKDRKKENLNKEPTESKWKPATQARVNRAGRGNYPSRYTSQDAGGGRNSAAAKGNTPTPPLEKGTSKAPLVTAQETKKSSAVAVSNGPSSITSPSSNPALENLVSASGGVNQSKSTSNAGMSKSDPILVPSNELPVQGAVATIQLEVVTQRTLVEQLGGPTDSKSSSDINSASEVENSNFEKIGPSPATRPSSNYNNRTQVTGSPKVSPGKEWKPKSTNSSVSHGAASSEVSTVVVGSHPVTQPTPVILTPREDSLELQRKLDESHISHRQHVIIPNHIHVPDAEKLGFCFGSFDASFGIETSHSGVDESEKSPPLSGSSVATDEPVKELQLSNQNALLTVEDSEIKYPDQAQLPVQGSENSAYAEVGVSSSLTPEYSESTQEVAPGTHQQPMLNTSNYNFGFMPPVMSDHQFTPLETAESQAHDAPRIPGFVVQQSFDPASYYAQFYRPGIDSDGRISPFHSAGAANKYNGIAALVSPQSSQSPQEGGVPMVLSTASPAPLVTQAAGVMQNSIPTQQPLPVFRHPNGVHLPYPPNYFPYGPYFSPFYPPPAIHQFLSNGTFSQQPQAGNLYSAPPGATAKYSVSQYKQGSNAGNSTHVGIPGSYAPYGLSVANYNSNPASAPVTSTSNEDLAASQAKENNIYVNGQQSESSGVWFNTPGRDISSMQASSFYNLPQGQLGFSPTQPGHGVFPGIFHPAQATPVHPLLQPQTGDMIGQTTSMYQQTQHSQINWPSNY